MGPRSAYGSVASRQTTAPPAPIHTAAETAMHATVASCEYWTPRRHAVAMRHPDTIPPTCAALSIPGTVAP